ncbi:MAG: DNA repair exonuclease [Phycisphaerae bacterium]|jgi:DNA repair exonuclease SbcCD nuclease subunit|nr:DNA repair exonuclease [Phycisphaerae bacterium]
MGTDILCTADVHLGRSPGSIAGRPVGADLSVAAAWQRLIDKAVEMTVDVVALAGDIADRDNALFEAFSLLQSGVSQLVDAGIEVVAVAGNHDSTVLPRLVAELPQVHFIGAGGRWEDCIIQRDGRPVLRVRGWSFPGPSVSDSPLATCPDDRTDLPTLGLLHCDPETPSHYAPVKMTEFAGKGVDAWVIGHLHRPLQRQADSPLVVQCGSLCPLDPSETGPHGPWLITLGDHQPRVKQLSLAPLRWEPRQIDTSDLHDSEQLEEALMADLRATHRELSAEGSDVTVACRLELTGRTPLFRQIKDITAAADKLEFAEGDVRCVVDGVVNNTAAAVDLDERARSDDPAGLLARRLIVLERREPAEEYHRLIAEGRRQVADVRSKPAFGLLSDGQDDEEELRMQLLRAGNDLMEDLLAKREGGE